MPPQKSEPCASPTAELNARQEGENVRVLVKATSGNYLFVDSRRDRVLKTYASYVERVRRFFARRWQGPACARLGEAAFRELTRNVTLDWMYFYIINHQPVRFLVDDLGHPSTWRIIQRIVESGTSIAEAERAAACAQLMGISEAEFRNWLIGEEHFLSR